MITTPKEYYDHLYLLQTQNPPRLAVLQSAERTYDINLEERLINSPKFLSIEHDHQSETIYFKVDRFHDYMDLSTTTCIIQYINAKGEAKIYAVPFYDITTCAKEDKMLLPWCVQGAATAEAGTVEYSIRFYKLDDAKKEFIYNLNTQPTTSEVLYGMNVSELTGDYDLSADAYTDLLARINGLQKMDVYWLSV